MRTSAFAPTGSNEIAELCVEALDGRRRCCWAATEWSLSVSPAAALVTCQSVERQAQIAWLLTGRP